MKNPYEILGVRQSASKDEIRNAFSLIEKKYYAGNEKTDVTRTGHENAGAGQGNTAVACMTQEEFKEIEKAYCELMGYPYYEKLTDDSPNEVVKIFKFSIDKKKMKNFFHYHTVHIIVGIIILLTMVISLKECATRVKPDLNVGFVGAASYREEQAESFRQEIKAVLGVNEIMTEQLAFTDEIKTEQDIAMREKSMLMVVTGGYDVMIVDKSIYDVYAKSGAFIELDGYYEQFGLDRQNNKDLKVKDEETGAEHYYGVLVEDHPLLKRFYFNTKGKILALPVQAENRENGVRLFEYILKSK